MKQGKTDKARQKQTPAAPWHFRDLIVWQRAMTLAKEIYRITSKFPKQEVFGLTSQLRRAAVSVASNIAEGTGRTTRGEMRIFFGHSRGSLYEVETQLCLAESFAYLDHEALQKLLKQCWEITRMLNALINKLGGDHA